MQPKELCVEISERLKNNHIGIFKGHDKPLFLISEHYAGVWLEHVYDSVFYAMMNPGEIKLAENTINIFIDNQSESGQLPCYILDGNKKNCSLEESVGYTQIQECVSFAKLCLMTYELNKDIEFLKKVYAACKKWENWLSNTRMTLNSGLVEMFVGFDTGHDNSGRLQGLSCKGKYILPNGTKANAEVLPPNEKVAPVIAVDMNCNYFATLMALSKMAELLNFTSESEKYHKKAKDVKKRLFEVCFDPCDVFFYDVDKNGNKRKYLSSTIFHLFLEGVLDKNEDAELIDELYDLHINNPNEFATPYPFPSMAVCDPSCRDHTTRNCWGYYSQGLISLRATMWMDQYGFSDDFDNLCKKWVEAWTKHYDILKFGQELDPISGVPTRSSEWYSSTMLFYLYAVNRLGDKL